MVSVIIPVFNGEKYIRKCLDSILRQTYKELEIIVMDDGSSDNTAEICREYRQNDERVRVISRENKGVSYSRNEGVKLSKGKYILFVDSDDYIEENMIQVMLEHLIENNADMVQCGYVKEYVGRKEKEQVREKNTWMSKGDALGFYLSHLELCVVPWNKIVKREIMECISFPSDRRYEDEAVMYRTFYESKAVVHVDECFYHYTIHEDGFMQSHNMDEKSMLDQVKAKYDLMKYVCGKEPGLQEEVNKEFIWVLYMNNIKICSFRHKNPYVYQELRRLLNEYSAQIQSDGRISHKTLFLLRRFPFIIGVKHNIDKRKKK